MEFNIVSKAGVAIFAIGCVLIVWFSGNSVDTGFGSIDREVVNLHKLAINFTVMICGLAVTFGGILYELGDAVHNAATRNARSLKDDMSKELRNLFATYSGNGDAGRQLLELEQTLSNRPLSMEEKALLTELRAKMR